MFECRVNFCSTRYKSVSAVLSVCHLSVWYNRGQTAIVLVRVMISSQPDRATSESTSHHLGAMDAESFCYRYGQ